MVNRLRLAKNLLADKGVLYSKLKEDEKVQNYLNTVIAKVKAKGSKASSLELGMAANARLQLLASLENNFHRAPLRLPEEQLKKDIQAKLQALDRLNKGYIEVVEFGDGAMGVEAFQRMAAAYRTFAEDLEGAPVPTEYSPEDKAKFKTQIKSIAQPVYAKVAETLENALKKGEQLFVAGAPTTRAYIAAALNSARADRLPLAYELNFQKTSEWIMGDIVGENEIANRREALKNKQDDAQLWLAVGNYHALRGEWSYAKIFYQKAASINAKSVAAINNLAFMEGRMGRLQEALNGFKAALALDEFSLSPKKNDIELKSAREK
jgi:hypothetical protein